MAAMIDQLLTTMHVAGLQEAASRRAARGPRPRVRRRAATAATNRS